MPTTKTITEFSSKDLHDLLVNAADNGTLPAGATTGVSLVPPKPTIQSDGSCPEFLLDPSQTTDVAAVVSVSVSK